MIVAGLSGAKGDGVICDEGHVTRGYERFDSLRALPRIGRGYLTGRLNERTAYGYARHRIWHTSPILKQSRRKERAHAAGQRLHGPLMFAVVIVAVIFVMSMFFRVSNIQVEGTSIIRMRRSSVPALLEEGDNPFSLTDSRRSAARYPSFPI